MIHKVALAAVYWAAAAGCSVPGGDVTGARGSDSGDDAAALVMVDLPACEPTLASLRENVFSRTCQWSTCHGPGTPAWELILTEESTLVAVVGARSVSCPPWLLVDPGRPESSLLYRKVADEQPPCGERMPWGVGNLPPHAVTCLRGWIEGLDGRAGPDAAAEAGE